VRRTSTGSPGASVSFVVGTAIWKARGHKHKSLQQ
jgi:hypothetical protein